LVIRNLRNIFICLFVGLAVSAGIASGQQRHVTIGQDDEGQSSQDDQEFSRILVERPAATVIEPEDPKPAKPDKTGLPIEGSSVNDRRCRLVNDTQTGWWIARFDGPAQSKADAQRWVMPSRLLEEMEQYAKDNPQANFRISGESFVYQNKPFILLGKVLIELPKPAEDVAAPAPALVSAPASTASQVTASTTKARPAGSKVVSRPSRAKASDDVLSKLMDQEPTRPILTPVEDPADQMHVASVAPIGNTQELLGGLDEMVVDRAVRLVQAEDGLPWWQVKFESDNTLQEPPIRLLPCALLENSLKGLGVQRAGKKYVPKKGNMPRAAIATEADIGVFEVSGVITQYKGNRYLLLRKCQRLRDMWQY
jgi:hypothetical protein